MADPMQQARELLAAEFPPSDPRRSALIRGGTALDLQYGLALRAIAAALCAVPEGFVLVPVKQTPEVDDYSVDLAAKALHANGADSLTSDTPWAELHQGEISQFRSWARSALIAARPQGVSE